MSNQKPVLFGIKNCDTIKKARKWLESQSIDYTFHDYRVDGINTELLEKFEQHLSWEDLVNKRGTTYRQLDDTQKENMSRDNAFALLVEYPAMVKRPVLHVNGEHHLGFKAENYAAIFGK
ncbi:ArsC family reductase [Algicola sagamiensis]|uniref:ArsC family reductase n=1 Tax=Algicola sagamiensis TaxID=163869 RepID=UPI000379DD85|nr:ArsC family reductase [Algicola sagamiensis]